MLVIWTIARTVKCAFWTIHPNNEAALKYGVTFSVRCHPCNLAFDRVTSDERLAWRVVGSADILWGLHSGGLFEVWTLGLSKRNKSCKKNSSQISKLTSAWVEGSSCKIDLLNLSILSERLLKLNDCFYCLSLQGPDSAQWFPERSNWF